MRWLRRLWWRVCDWRYDRRGYGYCREVTYPPIGTWYYVDPICGSDDNDGLSPESAFKSAAAAIAHCTAGKNDATMFISGAAAEELFFTADYWESEA